MAEPNIAMCDQDGCKEPATLSYRWDWGQGGQCCQRHGLLLQQTATNLSRTISLVALAAAAPLPLDRSERTQLIAAKLSAEAEANEIKERGAQLYNQNVELTRQVQTLTLKNREANAALELRDEQLADARAELDRRTAQLADATNELQRLQTLAAFTPEKSKGKQAEGKSKPEG